MAHPVWRGHSMPERFAGHRQGKGFATRLCYGKIKIPRHVRRGLVLAHPIITYKRQLCIFLRTYHYPVGSRELPDMLGPGLTPDNSYSVYSLRGRETLSKRYGWQKYTHAFPRIR